MPKEVIRVSFDARRTKRANISVYEIGVKKTGVTSETPRHDVLNISELCRTHGGKTFGGRLDINTRLKPNHVIPVTGSFSEASVSALLANKGYPPHPRVCPDRYINVKFFAIRDADDSEFIPVPT